METGILLFFLNLFIWLPVVNAIGCTMWMFLSRSSPSGFANEDSWSKCWFICILFYSLFLPVNFHFKGSDFRVNFPKTGGETFLIAQTIRDSLNTQPLETQVDEHRELRSFRRVCRWRENAWLPQWACQVNDQELNSKSISNKEQSATCASQIRRDALQASNEET